MISFPICKINIGLYIKEKRIDGYHNIETILYPIPFSDILEIVPTHHHIDTTLSGIPLSISIEDNICIKAYKLLKKDFPNIPSIHIYLHKCIPTGGGLGGGSSNGTNTLQLLNNLFHLSCSTKQLQHYASNLGSDCAFFLQPSPCFAIGRGEQLTPLSFSLVGLYMLLIIPLFAISTAWAYSQITHSLPPSISLLNAISQPIASWKNIIYNQFEDCVFKEYPLLLDIKNTLYKEGAIYASLTGSGSCLYGIFKEKKNILLKDKGIQLRWIQL